jgi:hypothetical protein
MVHIGRLVGLGLILSALPLPAAAQGCPNPAELTRGLSLPFAAVRYLADDALQGRRAGSAGEQCAADYVAAEMSRLGLHPSGANGTWFQEVPLASAINPHATGGTGRNVVGLLPGADPVLRNEWIVVGAHIDHLGDGGSGSLAPGAKAIHNGADDNASGVATLLRTAQRLLAGPRPARSILFVAFTGEESGLLGSAYFTSHPLPGSGVMVGMVNMDMVGRLGTGPLIIYGVDTAEEWRTLVPAAAERVGVTISTRGEGYGPSDHTSFYMKDVPVLHFFTNSHADYHKPSDDWEKVDRSGLETIASLVTDLVTITANRAPVALTLKRGAGEPLAARTGSESAGAYLGSVPDFSPAERGVKLSGVTPGSPADRAGLQAADIVLAIGDRDVADLQGMTDALRAHKPGDTVPVKVRRGADMLTVQVTLGSRATRPQ